MKKRIESLQALRAIAMAGIVMAHFGIRVSWAHLGVAIFFVISGFVSAYTADSSVYSSKTVSVERAFSRIKKIYPLHIITMLAVMMLQIAEALVEHNNGIAVGVWLRNLVMNLFLVQSWLPNLQITLSFNGVAWFLSALYFILIFEGFIIKYTNKLAESRAKGTLSIIGILAAQIMAAALVYKVFGISEIFEWSTYHSPLFRVGDYAAGCIIGRLYKDGKLRPSGTAKELAVTAAVVAFYVFKQRVPKSNLSSMLLNNTTLYCAFGIMLVCIFVTSKGVITGVMTNRITVFLGDYSGYVYLIHYAIIIYVNTVIGHLGIAVTRNRRVLLCLIEITMSYAIAWIYGKCIKRNSKKDLLPHAR